MDATVMQGVLMDGVGEENWGRLVETAITKGQSVSL